MAGGSGGGDGGSPQAAEQEAAPQAAEEAGPPAKRRRGGGAAGGSAEGAGQEAASRRGRGRGRKAKGEAKGQKEKAKDKKEGRKSKKKEKKAKKGKVKRRAASPSARSSSSASEEAKRAGDEVDEAGKATADDEGSGALDKQLAPLPLADAEEVAVPDKAQSVPSAEEAAKARAAHEASLAATFDNLLAALDGDLLLLAAAPPQSRQRAASLKAMAACVLEAFKGEELSHFFGGLLSASQARDRRAQEEAKAQERIAALAQKAAAAAAAAADPIAPLQPFRLPAPAPPQPQPVPAPGPLVAGRPLARAGSDEAMSQQNGAFDPDHSIGAQNVEISLPMAVGRAVAKAAQPAAPPAPRQYVVAKTLLDKASGLKMSRGKDTGKYEDLLDWGDTAFGVVEDGWLRVGNLYLPMQLNGVPVLKPGGPAGRFVADPARLNVCAGLRYSVQKGQEDKESGTAPWGAVVTGIDEGDGWVKCDYRYLPKRLNGTPVLFAAKEGAKPQPGPKAVVAKAKPKAPAAGEATGTPKAGDAAAAEMVFAICKEMQEKRKVVINGKINANNLRWFAVQMIETPKKASLWESSWVQLCLPEEQRNQVGAEFVRIMLDLLVRAPGDRLKPIADGLAYLTRAHRIRVATVEDVIANSFAGILEKCPSACQLVSWLLFHWFPRPKGHGWGWSRIGWSWQEWWKLTERVLQTLPAPVAFETLQGTLAHMQAHEGGKAIFKQELWTEARLALLRDRLRQLCGAGGSTSASSAGAASDDAVKAKLGGVNIWGRPPAAGQQGSSSSSSSSGSSSS